MSKVWSFQSNAFAVSTKGTQVTALSLFTDVNAKLLNESHDTEIAAMHAEFDPVFRAYKQIYDDRQVYLGNYEGQTMDFEQQLEQLNIQLRRWEGIVRAEFYEDSVQEHSIFPNKRAPFQTGTYDSRLSAVRSLATKLADFPQFTALRNAVVSFSNQLESTRLTQQQAEGQSGKISDLIENQRILTCNVLYGIIGLLMHKFQHDPSQISRFFDLSLIREIGTNSATADDVAA